jgi:arginase
VSCPFHNGRYGVSMGRGASRLAADEALRKGIQAEGWTLSDERIEPIDEPEPEIGRVMEIVRRLAAAVRQAVADGAFPLVLAGYCNSCLGTTAGIGVEPLGVVWFDAHADFDDPDENTSGFFDVMGLAMLTGRGWRSRRQTVPGLRPIPERHVILAGARDLEPHQRRRLGQSSVVWIPGSIDPGRFEQAAADLATQARRVYLHVDLDSLGIDGGRANRYAAGGGPTLDRLIDCVRLVCARLGVTGAAITAYDPGYDADDRALAAAGRVAGEIARGAARTPAASDLPSL